jgi:hypothetical protein
MNGSSCTISASIAVALCTLSCVACAGQVCTLVKDGEPSAVVVLPADAAPDEKRAAEEIVEHVRLMSGAELKVMPAEGAEAAAMASIRIGRAADAELEALIRKHGDDAAAFALVVAANTVSIRGLSPEGTLFGACEMLEQLGVRWFMPGDFGRVVPEARTITVPAQQTVQVPDFPSRHLQIAGAGEPWYKRWRLGGPFFPSAHGFPITADIAREPDMFALVGGKRTTRQWCVSNPEVLRRTIEATKNYFRKNPQAPWIGMGPNDGSGFCECANCRALDAGDWDAFSGEVSVTDRYIWFFNQVLKGIEDEFPQKKLAFYCYHAYMRPPLREKPDPRIVPAFAPITLCRVHGMNNPICPERSYYRFLMAEWCKLLPEVFERGYFFNLACPGFPFSMVHRVRDEIPYAKKAGIKGWRVECNPSWGIYTPTLYVAAKLFWDCDRDVEALLDDFYRCFFGPAAEPMKRYFERMDAALRDADYHTGCSFNMPDFYPPELRKAARADLTEAGERAGDTIYGKRVAAFRLMFDGLEEFIAMLDARDAFDFIAANDALKRLQDVQKRAFEHEPALLYDRMATSYLRRFWSRCVEEGYERTTGGNELVAGLPDRWDFLIDTNKLGEELGYWRADVNGGNWQTIATKSASWSDQGLRYYKGDAWYRSRVRIPEKFKGRKIMLWFGGVDEKVKVWVNGTLIGESPGRAFVPCEFDATAAVTPGSEAVVTVRATNLTLDELGTGGITAPVMFWSPRLQP